MGVGESCVTVGVKGCVTLAEIRMNIYWCIQLYHVQQSLPAYSIIGSRACEGYMERMGPRGEGSGKKMMPRLRNAWLGSIVKEKKMPRDVP